MNKIQRFFREFLTPDLPKPSYTLQASFHVMGESTSERNHRENVETMMDAEIRLQWEVQRRTLVFVQRTNMIAILSLFVTMITLVFALLKD